MKDLVSIILPVYNGERYLAEAIESVLTQSYEEIELIVVNDCSTDSSENIILQFCKKDNRIKYVKNESNCKLPKSLNNGFAVAKGKYLTWTSDDNLFHKDAIERMVSFLNKNEEIGMVYCDYNLIDEHGKYIDNVTVGDKKELPYKNIIGACFLYRNDIAKKIGDYATNMFLVEDYEYWLRIHLASDIEPLHLCLYDYRIHGNSLSEQRKNEVQEALKRLRWVYLEKYEKCAHISEEWLYAYFEYILGYEEIRFKRIMLRCSFALKHKSYFRNFIRKRK